MLKLCKVKALGLQKMAFGGPPEGLGKGKIDWVGKVRVG